jgi:hypothetical protein
VEIFIVPGANDTEKELALLRETLGEISPRLIELNTLDRPGTCPGVLPASPERLQQIADFFKPLPVGIIARNDAVKTHRLPGAVPAIPDAILEAVKRRPCTLADLETVTGLTAGRIRSVVRDLESRKCILSEKVGSLVFYRNNSQD